MELLRDMKDDTQPEVVRIRQILINAVNDYSAAVNVDHARLELWTKLRAVEAALSTMTIGRVRNMSKQLGAQAKRLGRSSKQGRAVHEVAQAVRDLYNALDALKEASNARDESLRIQAHDMLLKAQDKMAKVQERYGDL